MNELLFALWFFLPAGLANAAPVLFNKIPVLQNFNAPLDGKRTFRGKRLFGENKRWRGLVGGTLVGGLIGLLQMFLAWQWHWFNELVGLINYASVFSIVLGALLGAGALIGDAIESFFKRQCNVEPGRSWFPFDQIDYIIGGLLMSALVVRLPWSTYMLILFVWFGAHLLFSFIGYLLSLKDRPI